ncbi:bifunctional 4-hydroxy-2-oxoglutarate aldolase/2-dehydro-3-deoxy-phosphogluconate aldolase [Corallincola platygyrae]|uniref:2-dehydro-3-deoxy-phosphogluconate aldolase n=1 Tax=Corallincola platygyrae TaxID=1193278 RepID=A0ABW4XJY0_9GAMM
MTAFLNWSLKPEQLLSLSPVVPVIVIEREEDALPMAEALLAGGISLMEITLRTAAALPAIETIARKLPEVTVGAGTVYSKGHLQQVSDAGGQFAISPGGTPALLTAAANGKIPLLPGISTVSELMQGIELGYSHFKFFPAEACGGVKALKAISGPFPDIKFCPTGGISQENYRDYLALKTVACVGGSWLVPGEAVRQGDFSLITRLAKEALAAFKS